MYKVYIAMKSHEGIRNTSVVPTPTSVTSAIGEFTIGSVMIGLSYRSNYSMIIV